MLLRGFADLKPDYVAVAFDLSGPTFRHEQYAEYKATRTRMPDDLATQLLSASEASGDAGGSPSALELRSVTVRFGGITAVDVLHPAIEQHGGAGIVDAQ